MLEAWVDPTRRRQSARIELLPRRITSELMAFGRRSLVIGGIVQRRAEEKAEHSSAFSSVLKKLRNFLDVAILARLYNGEAVHFKYGFCFTDVA